MSKRELHLVTDQQDLEAEASELLIRRRKPTWSLADQRSLDARLAHDPAFAVAYRWVQASWEAVGHHATSPELMAFREQAIARARKVNVRRWSLPGGSAWSPRRWAVAAMVLVAACVGWQLSPYGYEPGLYKTGLGEQRAIELADHSHLALDAKTRIKVRFTEDARVVELLEGQAQFSVAKDPRRPFKVEAGAKTIVAVGTVFDVAYIDREVKVSMVEGRVAVLSRDDGAAPAIASGAAAPEPVELSAGQGLQVSRDGSAAVLPKADLEAATAWRQGRVIFRDVSLAEAVHRLNRYSKQQVVIDDPALAKLRVNGVFDSGDAQAFAEAMQTYISVAADFSHGATIHLRTKSSP